MGLRRRGGFGRVRASVALSLRIWFTLSTEPGRVVSVLKSMHKKPGAEKCGEIAVFVRKQESSAFLFAKSTREIKVCGTVRVGDGLRAQFQRFP